MCNEKDYDFIDTVLAGETTFHFARERVLREFERRFLERALAQHNGNISRAAAATGIARRYFYVMKQRVPR